MILAIKLPLDIALFWVVMAIGALTIGFVIFVIKRGFLENETHIDKMKDKMKGGV